MLDHLLKAIKTCRDVSHFENLHQLSVVENLTYLQHAGELPGCEKLLPQQLADAADAMLAKLGPFQLLAIQAFVNCAKAVAAACCSAAFLLLPSPSPITCSPNLT